MNFEKHLQDFVDFIGGRSEKSEKVNKKLEHIYKSLIYNSIFILYLFLMGIIILAFISPILTQSNHPGARGVGMMIMILSGILRFCHQLPYRSIMLLGIQQPVCARDMGIYFGAVLGIGILFLPQLHKLFGKKRILIISILPIALDGVTQTILNLRESNNTLRIITGFIFSFGYLGFFSISLFRNQLEEFKEKVFKKKIIFIDILVTLLLLQSIFTALTPVGEKFLSKQQVLNKQFQHEDLNGKITEIHYFPSNTPFTIRYDPYYEKHQTPVLNGLREMTWVDEHMKIGLEKGGRPPHPNELLNNTDLIKVLGKEMLEHRLGIWAITVKSDTSTKIIYLDAFTHKAITEKNQ